MGKNGRLEATDATSTFPADQKTCGAGVCGETSSSDRNTPGAGGANRGDY